MRAGIRIGIAIGSVLLVLIEPRLGVFATSSGPLKSYRQILQEHNVELTVPGMLRALKDSEVEIVREAAASELAAQPGAADWVGELAEILASEKSPGVRIAIGYGLGRLGDERGIRALDAVCLDRSINSLVRTNSARAMFALASYKRGHGAPRQLLFDLLSDYSEEWPATRGRIEAFGLVPDYVRSGLSKSDLDVVTDSAIKSLRSADIIERQSAASAFRFGRFGGQRAISELERTLAVEENEVIRLEIRAALKALREQ